VFRQDGNRRGLFVFIIHLGREPARLPLVKIPRIKTPNLCLSSLLCEDIPSFSDSTLSSSNIKGTICSKVEDLEEAKSRINRLWMEMEEIRRKE